MNCVARLPSGACNRATGMLFGVGIAMLAAAIIMRFQPWHHAEPSLSSGERLIEITPMSNQVKAANGAQVPCQMEIRNISPYPVALTMDKPSCDCTDAAIDDNLLQPSGVTSARFSIQTLGHADDFEVAAVVHATARLPHGANQSERREALFAKVRILLDKGSGVRPAIVDFGDVSREAHRIERPFEVRLPNSQGAPARAVEAAASAPWLSLELTPVAALGKVQRYEGKAVVEPSKISITAGPFGADASIRIGQGHESTLLRFRLVGNLKNEIEVSPAVLYWSRKDLKGAIHLTFGRAGGAPLAIKEVSCESGEILAWTIHHNGTPSPMLEVKCIYQGTASSEIIRSALRAIISCDGRTEVTVAVPVIIL